MAQSKRAALYLRVSTDGQTTENQRLELEAAAMARGWLVVAIYSDEGISGGKGRDQRPGLDSLLKGAVKRQFDVVMAWAVDRLGRSLPDLVGTMQELHGAKVDLFLHQQSLDTTTPAGRAMFGMLAVFSEFERSMIVSRINAGIARVKAGGTKSGKPIGRPATDSKTEAMIRERLAAGVGMTRISRELSVGCGTVLKIKRQMAEAQENVDDGRELAIA
jgi:DNA invertase Pin-like site-specific DNA recombinase